MNGHSMSKYRKVGAGAIESGCMNPGCTLRVQIRTAIPAGAYSQTAPRKRWRMLPAHMRPACASEAKP